MKSEFEHFSMIRLPPVLSKFPWAGIESCSDILGIFRFEPMHVSSLEISRLLKVCLINFLDLGDTDRRSQALPKKNGYSKTIKKTRNVFLQYLNKYLKDIAESSSRPKLQVDFSRNSDQAGSAGLF